MLATDTKQTCKVRVLEDGQAVDALIEGIATQDRQRKERLCRAAVIDISQQKRADESAAASRIARDSRTPETVAAPATVAFDPGLALSRCCDSQEMLREMIGCFFDDVDNLLPQMRAALKTGNLVEVGRLGHRMKGTLVYFGAEPVEAAAIRVERFCESNGGTPSEAEEAINALEHECMTLKAALSNHPLAAEPKQGD